LLSHLLMSSCPNNDMMLLMLVFFTGCELLDFVVTNDYILILTSKGLYVSNHMSNSSSVNGVRMSLLTFARSFDYTKLGCSSLPVSLKL